MQPIRASTSVKRQVDTRKLLNVLRAAKSRQDETAQPYRGRGLWLSSKQWHALIKHLEKQVSEVEVLEQVIIVKEQEAEKLRQHLETESLERARLVDELHAQAAHLREQAEFPLAELGALRAQMRSKQETWDKQKHELEGQMDRLMGMLRTMGLLADSEGQRLASTPSPPPRAQDLTTLSDLTGLLAPEVQALQVRELSMLLADARHQAESYRRQLAMRSIPAEEMAIDIRRLKADNQRLVALLAKVPEYKAMAEELAAESGVQYIPVEECLMIRGQVEQLYPQLLDRPIEEAAGQDLAAAGRRRDPDATDSSLTLVLDEQYHWVPRKALETGMALMRRMLPALPLAQLMVLVAELNKIWRDRERKRLAEVAAAHREELRQLQHTFQQRAPYEAVVAGQKVNDLKRRMRMQAAQAAVVAAAAKAEQRRAEDDSKVMLHAGLSSIQDLSRQVARLVTRNKKLAGKAARQRALGSQPICNACFDRLLLSDNLGQPVTGVAGVPQPSYHQQQQEQEQAPTDPVAWQPHEPDATALAATAATTRPLGTTPFQGGPFGYMPEHITSGRPRSSCEPHGYDDCGSRMPLDANQGCPDRRLGADIPTFNLTARTASGTGASTELYNAGTVVHASTVPVAAPLPASVTALPIPPPARPQDGTCPVGSYAATLTAANAAHRTDSDVSGLSRELPATVPGSGSGPGVVHPSSGTNDAACNGASAGPEVSAASLADWRTASSGPIMVQLQVGSSDPAPTLVLHSRVAQGSKGSSSAANSAVPQVQSQSRGVPIRVCVRFPRHDVAGSQ